MGKKRIVVVGSNAAGFTAAIAVKRALGTHHDVTVISRAHRFVFRPSLVRLALGNRTERQTTFPLRTHFANQGIAFRNEPAVRLDLDRRKVITLTTEENYDFLVIATGARPNYGAVPGLGPRGYTQSITTLAEANGARAAFDAFLKAPGPVVIGDVQGAVFRRPAFELLLNVARILKERGLSQMPVTHLTSGPAVPVEMGFCVIAHAAVAQIEPGQIILGDGRKLSFAFGMLLPSLLGEDVVRACEKITDPTGLVRVNQFEQTLAYPEVFSIGAAVAGARAEAGCIAEQTSQRLARNIAASIVGDSMVGEPLRPDASADGSVTSDEGWLVAGPETSWAQRAFERYFPAAASDGSASSTPPLD